MKTKNTKKKEKRKKERNGIDRGNVMEGENWESWLHSPLNQHIVFEWRLHII